MWLTAALAKLTPGVPIYQPPAPSEGLFIQLGESERGKNFPELDVRQSYRKDNMNEQKSVCSPGSLLLPVGKLYNA